MKSTTVVRTGIETALLEELMKNLRIEENSIKFDKIFAKIQWILPLKSLCFDFIYWKLLQEQRTIDFSSIISHVRQAFMLNNKLLMGNRLTSIFQALFNWKFLRCFFFVLNESRSQKSFHWVECYRGYQITAKVNKKFRRFLIRN